MGTVVDMMLLLLVFVLSDTVEALKFKQDMLFDFIENGGNMIVQYDTNHRLLTDNLAP